MPDTICVFDGFCISETYDKEAKWSGVCMASEEKDAKKVNEIPRNAFKGQAEGALSFDFTGTVPKPPADTTNFFQECTLEVAGKFENGSASNKVEDASHTVMVSGLRWAGGNHVNTLCFGSGKNELGNFIEAGWMKPGNRIVMARRYVDDDRAKWSVEEVKKNVKAKIYDEKEDTIIMPPWHCETFNA